MKANELRIGNYVGEDVLGEVSVISIETEMVWVDAKHMRSGRVIEDQSYHLDINSVISISLTEDWLLKFGFELLTDKKKGYKNTSYSHEKIPILLYWDGSRLSTTFWQGNEMRFVHQLQNLIFALTGTELEIK